MKRVFRVSWNSYPYWVWKDTRGYWSKDGSTISELSSFSVERLSQISRDITGAVDEISINPDLQVHEGL